MSVTALSSSVLSPVVGSRVLAARALHPAGSTDAQARSLSPDVLTAIATGLASALGTETPTLAPGQDRAFVRLLATPVYEAWLIAWAPTGALEFHDHGGACGAVHVVRGRLTESYVDRPGDGRVRTRTRRAASSFVVPPERVHEVWNPGPGHALSVHAYSPPLSAMTFFDRESDGSLRSTRTVRGELPVGEEATSSYV